MIPAAYIRTWAQKAPWPRDEQIEQDLILSRLIIEIADDDLLGPELVFRGGTCLHKLHLPSPLRYSDDLDYVRRTRSGVKPYMLAIRKIAIDMGLREHGYQQRGDMVHMIFDARPTMGDGTIRIRIETNIREVESFEDRVALSYEIQSDWWSGKAAVSTFTVEELTGTKLRCLYQRKKGRDLFDLWYVLDTLDVDDERIVTVLDHYMKDDVFSYPQLAANLVDKIDDDEFRSDIEDLIATPLKEFDISVAADLVIQRLGSRLKNAPDVKEIENGSWRV